LVILVIF